MVRRLVDYLYTGNYEMETSDSCFVPLVHMTMFALGDKYFIDGLKAPPANTYSKALSQGPDVTFFLRSVSEVHKLTLDSARGLSDRATCFAEERILLLSSAQIATREHRGVLRMRSS